MPKGGRVKDSLSELEKSQRAKIIQNLVTLSVVKPGTKPWTRAMTKSVEAKRRRSIVELKFFGSEACIETFDHYAEHWQLLSVAKSEHVVICA